MADVHVAGLTVEFARGGEVVRPLDEFNLDAASGELVVLLGPSGCGKTTLLSCLAGILSPAAGVISVAGADVTALTGAALTTYRRHTVGIVFQAFNLLSSLSAMENVATPLWAARINGGRAKARATELLALVDLTPRADHKPGQLSGGQQQRVAIARALAHDPPLVLADEPTAHLDYVQVEGVLRVLRELAAPGRTVMIATHDERILGLADRVVRLGEGRPSEPRPPGRLRLAAGETLFRQGDRSDLIYVVDEGEIELLRAASDGHDAHLALLGPGRYFGELGPMLGLPRSATAIAHTDTVLTALTAAEFRSRRRD